MPGASKRRFTLHPSLELERIITLAEAYDVCGLSPDAIRDNYPDLVIRLSPRRVGIKLKHALGLGQQPAERTPAA
jgi:hypothetical protein